MPVLHSILEHVLVTFTALLLFVVVRWFIYIFGRPVNHEGLPYSGGGDADPHGGAREWWHPPPHRGVVGEGDSPPPRARADRRNIIISSSSSSSTSSQPPLPEIRCKCHNSPSMSPRGSCLITRRRTPSGKHKVWFCSCVLENQRPSSAHSSPTRYSAASSHSEERIPPSNFAGRRRHRRRQARRCSDSSADTGNHGRRPATRRSDLNAPINKTFNPLGVNIPLISNVDDSRLCTEDYLYSYAQFLPRSWSLEFTISGDSFSSSSYPSDPEILSTNEFIPPLDDQHEIVSPTEHSDNTEGVDLLSEASIGDPQELSDLYETADESPFTTGGVGDDGQGVGDQSFKPASLVETQLEHHCAGPKSEDSKSAAEDGDAGNQDTI